MSINKVILVGNLGKDPEVRTFESGKGVANFTIATSDRYKDKDGNWQDKTEWTNCVTFRAFKFVGDYCKKGDKVSVVGKLQTRSYESNGVTKYVTEVICDEVNKESKKEEPTTQNREPQPQGQSNTTGSDPLPF